MAPQTLQPTEWRSSRWSRFSLLSSLSSPKSELLWGHASLDFPPGDGEGKVSFCRAEKVTLGSEARSGPPDTQLCCTFSRFHGSLYDIISKAAQNGPVTANREKVLICRPYSGYHHTLLDASWKAPRPSHLFTRVWEETSRQGVQGELEPQANGPGESEEGDGHVFLHCRPGGAVTAAPGHLPGLRLASHFAAFKSVGTWMSQSWASQVPVQYLPPRPGTTDAEQPQIIASRFRAAQSPEVVEKLLPRGTLCMQRGRGRSSRDLRSCFLFLL